MHTTNLTALELVHRLLFRAIVEIRAQGHEQKNKLVFHLADLFHNCVLDMKAAATGELDYDDVLHRLEEKAGEKHLDRWLQATLTEIDADLPAPSGS